MTCAFSDDKSTAFNSDPFSGPVIEKLIKVFDCKVAIETGTYHGVTTRWLSDRVSRVYSIEIDKVRHDLVKSFLESRNQNVTICLGSSEKWLDKILQEVNKTSPVFFYLDAHGNDYWPLRDEIKTIGKYCHDNAIIVIDDFKVP